MYEFIWDSKPDKIKRTISSLDYIVGGLKIPNLNKFNEPLKTTWIRRNLTANGK